MTSVPVYALIITHFGQNWGFLTILTLLPTYFEKVLHMDIKHVILSPLYLSLPSTSPSNSYTIDFKQNSLMSSLPYLLQAIVAWIASFISDKLRQKQILNINVIRKTNNTIGMQSIESLFSINS